MLVSIARCRQSTLGDVHVARMCGDISATIVALYHITHTSRNLQYVTGYNLQSHK
jgi:hypothetical protein